MKIVYNTHMHTVGLGVVCRFCAITPCSTWRSGHPRGVIECWCGPRMVKFSILHTHTYTYTHAHTYTHNIHNIHDTKIYDTKIHTHTTHTRYKHAHTNTHTHIHAYI
jgi:hypothetical protein